MLILNRPYGRLGNNIYQIINIMYEGLHKKSKINISNFTHLNNIFDVKKVEENFNSEIETDNTKKEIGDFFPRNLHLPEKRLIKIEEYFNIGKKFIIPYLKVKDNFDDRICVIHVRSDDEFSSFNRKSSYVQPPFSYYKKIIDHLNEKMDRFIIVSSPDMRNPCINILRNYNKKIEIQSKSVYEDYITLLKTQTIVLSRSSFSDTSVFINPNLKNIYFWEYNHCLKDTDVVPKEIGIFPLYLSEKYITSEEWCSSRSQRHLMLNYNIDNVNFK